MRIIKYLPFIILLFYYFIILLFYYFIILLFSCTSENNDNCGYDENKLNKILKLTDKTDIIAIYNRRLNYLEGWQVSGYGMKMFIINNDIIHSITIMDSLKFNPLYKDTLYIKFKQLRELGVYQCLNTIKTDTSQYRFIITCAMDSSYAELKKSNNKYFDNDYDSILAKKNSNAYYAVSYIVTNEIDRVSELKSTTFVSNINDSLFKYRVLIVPPVQSSIIFTLQKWLNYIN